MFPVLNSRRVIGLRLSVDILVFHDLYSYMKTNHDYHGITLRNDNTGWYLQIRLNGTYHTLRAFCDTAEEAAYRYDVALSKLDAFTDDNARPNFPDGFDSIDISRDGNSDADKRAAYHEFWDALHRKFSQLACLAEETGQELETLRREKRERAAELDIRRAQKLDAERTVFRLTILRLGQRVPNLKFSAELSAKLSHLLKTTRETFDTHKQ